MYRVELTYFKPSGKWYSGGHYDSSQDHIYRIYDEVAAKFDTRTLPGLIAGHSSYHVLIEVPEHPYNVPHLLVAPPEE